MWTENLLGKEYGSQKTCRWFSVKNNMDLPLSRLFDCENLVLTPEYFETEGRVFS